MAEQPIYRSDDTGAFDQTWLEIDAEFPDSSWASRISRAELKISSLPVMTFNEPTFPISVNLTASQTAQLKDTETAFLAVYDDEGRKATCEGQLSFKTRSKKV